MGRIFKKQSALRVTLKTFADLESIVSAVIKYRKPGGARGEFPAGVSNAAKGVICHECLEGEIDASGWWAFWAFVVFADGRTAAGETAKVFVWHEGLGAVLGGFSCVLEGVFAGVCGANFRVVLLRQNIRYAKLCFHDSGNDCVMFCGGGAWRHKRAQGDTILLD